jgi:S1-C subfamily serine protease
MRRLIAVCCALAALSPLAAAKNKVPLDKLIPKVAPSVVQIVRTLDPVSALRIQASVQHENEVNHDKPGYTPQPVPTMRDVLGSLHFIAGTGFIVSGDGDVITADHVIKEIEDQKAKDSAIGVVAYYSLALVEPGGSSAAGFTFDIIDEDPAHDLALIRARIGNVLHHTNDIKFDGAAGFIAGATKFTVRNLRSGEDVFACGYPLNESSMVTTAGTVAATDVETLWTAKNYSKGETSQVTVLDIRINNGNSGGPLFLYSNQSVVGIVVEVRPPGPASSGPLAIAVPAKYITGFLDKNHVKWAASKR